MKKILKILTSLMVVCMLAFSFTPIYGADDPGSSITYTTEGGSWVPVARNDQGKWQKADTSDTYALKREADATADFDQDAKGEPKVLLEMKGSKWTFTFTTDSAGDYEYFVRETLTQQQQDQQYQLVDKEGRPISAITVKGNAAVLVNKKPIDSGNLYVEKQVSGTPANPDQMFRFDIQLEKGTSNKEVSGEQTFGSQTFIDGKTTVYLKSGENLNISGLPAGMKYTVNEVKQEGYTVSWSGVQNEAQTTGQTNIASGSITIDNTDSLIFTNEVIPEVPPTELGNLEVAKFVVNGVEGDIFTFRTSFQDLQASTTYTYTIGTESKTFTSGGTGLATVEFQLKNNESVKFEKIPYGSKYTILESATPGYTPAFKIAGTNVKAAQTQGSANQDEELSTRTETLDKDEEAVVTFTNTGENPDPDAPVMNIPIKKIWNDENDAAGKRPETITVKLYRTIDPETVTDREWNIADSITLSAEYAMDDNTWSYTFKNFPKADEMGKEYFYKAEEDTNNLGSYKGETVKNDDGSFTITNTFSTTPLPESGQAGIRYLGAAGVVAVGVGVAVLLKKNRKENDHEADQ